MGPLRGVLCNVALEGALRGTVYSALVLTLLLYGSEVWYLRGDLLAKLRSQVKSRITLQDTRSRHQAGAMRPVRRAGWVWAASCAPAAKAAWAECSCAGAAHRHTAAFTTGAAMPCVGSPRSTPDVAMSPRGSYTDAPVSPLRSSTNTAVCPACERSGRPFLPRAKRATPPLASEASDRLDRD